MIDERQVLLREAWTAGNLEYLLEDYQLPVYTALWGAIMNRLVLKFVCNIARRFGKTFTTSVVAIEYAIRHPNSIINYASPTDKEMKKILRSIFPIILAECPEDLKPKRVNGTWEFPNGSIIYTAGANNGNADNLRGNAAHLNIVDEAGQIDELWYLVRSILIPQQLTTRGTMLILSTPPSVVDHDYAELYHEAKEDDALIEFTVYDNEKVMNDPELLAQYIKESGGKENTAWLREYECKFVTDTNKIIVPEWARWKDINIIVPKKTDKYQFWHKYVGMDMGFNHNTALIFGHYDFIRAKFVIEREKVMQGEEVTSHNIYTATRDIEQELWGTPTMLHRIADNNNPILLNDIHQVHGMNFHPVTKDEKHAMVGEARDFIREGRLEVHPDCKYTLGCLEFGVWNKKRDAFAESKKYGHYDALDAIIYTLRHVDMTTNPVPADFGIRKDDVMWAPGAQLTQNEMGLKQLQNAFNKRNILRRGIGVQ